MEHIKEAFKALPHINKLWVTKDGNFHLHPNNGGDEVSRNDVSEAKPAKEKAEAKPAKEK